MYLKIVAAVIGIFLLSCVTLPNLISETDEGSTYHEEDSQEKAILDWLINTPEGRELSERAQTNPELLNDYARWIAEGGTHEQALQGWRGVPRRIARDIQDIPGEFDKIRRNPFGYYTGYAFTTRLFVGFYNVVRGNFDLTDILGALFIPCVVTFVLTKRESLQHVIAIIWSVDLIIDMSFWLHHLVATAIVAGLTALVRWAIQRAKEASANK